MNVIERSAFNKCENLKKISLSEGVHTINKYAFASFIKLAEIYLPRNVSNIDNKAFKNSPNITNCCEKGSYAEHFAKDNKLRYIYK